MFKSMLLVIVMMMITSASFAGRYDGSEANFKACVASDESWMRRWGQYLIDYRMNVAADKCRAKAWPSSKVRATRMGCYIKKKFVIAGYYCESL